MRSFDWLGEANPGATRLTESSPRALGARVFIPLRGGGAIPGHRLCMREP